MIPQNKCFECDSVEFIQYHHIVPKILGGTKTIPLCANCHGKVHDRDLLSMHKLSIQAKNKNGIFGGRPKKVELTLTEENKIKKNIERIKKIEQENEKINFKLSLENKIKQIFNDKTIVVKDACKMLNISRATYYRHAKNYESKININN